MEREATIKLCLSVTNEMRKRGIIFEEVLGRGSFSIVRKGYSKILNKSVAVKLTDTRSDSRFIKRCLPRELEILQGTRHENIIAVYDVVDTKPVVCVVLAYAERGDLLNKIKRKQKIDEVDGRIHFRQLIEAMDYLKSVDVVHRDIKCENVLLDEFDNIKLTDFGFARYLKNGEKSKTFCGSRAYLAPEIIRAQPYDGFLSDVWSVGVVLYVMVTGMMPYDDSNIKKMLEKQLQHRVSFPQTSTVSEDARRLIFDILHPVATQRLTYAKMIKSSWLIDTKYCILSERKSDSDNTHSAH